MPKSPLTTDFAAETLSVLKEIERHLAVLVKLQLQPRQEELLNTETLRNLFAATGSKSVAKLAEDFGVSTGKISTLWQKWERAGLLKKEGSQYVHTI